MKREATYLLALVCSVLVCWPVAANWEIQFSTITLVDSRGAEAPIELESAQAAATGHLDSDGVVDLVTGHAAGSNGALVVHRGNPAFRQGVRRDLWREAEGLPPHQAFVEQAMVFDLPFAPDWLAVGDFDADSDFDVACAAHDQSYLVWLPGDAHGRLGEPIAVGLPGTVTAFAAGDINRPDTLTDLVIAVTAGHGAAVLVFEYPEGAFAAEPEVFAMPTTVTDIEVGPVGSSGWIDIAVAAGDLIIINGRDRKLSSSRAKQAGVLPAEIRARTLAAPVWDLLVGRFNPGAKSQLMVRRTDGVLELMTIDETTIENDEVGRTWSDASSTLIAARTSGRPGSDLVVADPHEGTVRVLGIESLKSGRGELVDRAVLETGARNMLAARLNRDTREDLILLDGRIRPTVARTKNRAVLYVNSTADPGDGTCTAANCTLREAITAANNAGSGSDITMDLSIGATITPQTELPALTTSHAVTIDGTVGSGMYSSKLTIDGSSCTPVCNGLTLSGGNDTISDIAIGNFDASKHGVKSEWSGAGLSILSDDNEIVGSYFGFAASGATRPNDYGIVIEGSNYNTIGGTTSSDRNIVSGNDNDGILMWGDHYYGPYPDYNFVQGNYIGTSLGGSTATPNGGNGIRLDDTDHSQLGSAVPGGHNVISGNSGSGINIKGSPTLWSSVIVHNFVGFAADEVTPLPNGYTGIEIRDDTTPTIGGPTGFARNVVGGNGSHPGIHVWFVGGGALIQGNYLGIGSDGESEAGNETGLLVEDAIGLTIGGSTNGTGNVASANTLWGIRIGGTSGTEPDNIDVLGNTVGTNPAGTIAHGNGSAGILLLNCVDCTVGEAGNANAVNTVKGNDPGAVDVIGGSGNRITNNDIGNSNDIGAFGVRIDGCTDCWVNGGNTISYTHDGIQVIGDDATGVRIDGNSIFSCDGLGIDLGDDGVTLNDAGDLDTGPNSLQNFPVITSGNPATDQVTATLDTDSTYTSYEIQLFQSVTCGPGGHGPGQEYLGSVYASTNGSGHANISGSVPGLIEGRSLTAVAISPDNNTSEFSACYGGATDEIFSDGFESGDTTRWSETVP